jgi:hypothetical protein
LKFGCSEIGNGIDLFVQPGWRSIALAEVMSDSTGFRAPPGLMEGETVMFLSSNFAANNNAGPASLFKPRD